MWRSLESEIVKFEGITPDQNYSCPHCYDRFRGSFYLLGGTSIDVSAETMVGRHCYEFSCEDRTWTRLTDLPFSNGGANAVMYDEDTILVVGGAERNTDMRSSFFHGILEYKISKRSWTLIEVEGVNMLDPFNLIKPILVVIKSKLYIFCCTYENDGDVFHRNPKREPLIVFDVKSRKFSTEDQFGAYQLTANTEKVGFCVWKNRYIYVYGGQIKKSRIEDFYGERIQQKSLSGLFRRFDTFTNKWERVRYSGSNPVNNLCLHMFNVNDFFICCGGMSFHEKTSDYALNINKSRVNIFNIRSRTWSVVILKEPIFDRIGDSTVLAGSRLFSFGGLCFEGEGLWDESKTLNSYEMFLVDLKELPVFLGIKDAVERKIFIWSVLKDEERRLLGNTLEIRFGTLLLDRVRSIHVYRSFFV